MSPLLGQGSLSTFSYSQPDVRTIEGVLFDALVKTGAVSQDNADDPVKVSVRPILTDSVSHNISR